jgi:arylsulfatase A-like enzyme
MESLNFLALGIRVSNVVGLVALVFSLLLLAKSLLNFSQTGPRLRGEVLANYRHYLIFSLGRLTLAGLILSFLLALPGGMAYWVALAISDEPYSAGLAATACIASLIALTALQFCRVLHHSPGVIVASSLYAIDRFYPLWERLSPVRLKSAASLIWGLYAGWIMLGTAVLWVRGAPEAAAVLAGVHVFSYLALWALNREWEPEPCSPLEDGKPPNLLMIGSDTLRADRLGINGYRRALTPNLDRLAQGGALLGQCYVPCARTAPSLLSLFTGTWPHTHGIRDNFVDDEQTHVHLAALPRLLADSGYATAALGDWAGADLGKFDLGFQEIDVPPDQWNLKYFLRQGPKDIRLFLSLFTDNPVGKYFLEEIYYLGGIPLTRQLGVRTRQLLRRLGSGKSPFFLNVFMASTHPPFASEHPYYTLFADPAYRGPSKFAMARLTDPFEIIRRQGEPREEFDLDQILDLYDGCVKSFDDEVGRILDYLDRSGLAKNTLVVVYSDHGMEFFEHATWGQGNSAIGDFSARVPIILSGPSISQPIRLDCVTRTVDLAPTLIDLLGLTQPGGMDGASLADALRGGEAPVLPAFYETGIWLTDLPGMPDDHLRYPSLLDMLDVPDKRSGTLAIKPEFTKRIVQAKDRMVRIGRWKLVIRPLEHGRLTSLYDVETDPDCQIDVAAKHPEITERLWQCLQDWMRADARPDVDGANPPSGR